jgi:hypothetical protein
MAESLKPDKHEFDAILKLIIDVLQRSFQAVNTILIDLYWMIGAIISLKIELSNWAML